MSLLDSQPASRMDVTQLRMHTGGTEQRDIKYRKQKYTISSSPAEGHLGTPDLNERNPRGHRLSIRARVKGGVGSRRVDGKDKVVRAELGCMFGWR